MRPACHRPYTPRRERAALPHSPYVHVPAITDTRNVQIYLLRTQRTRCKPFQMILKYVLTLSRGYGRVALHSCAPLPLLNPTIHLTAPQQIRRANLATGLWENVNDKG